MTPGFELGILAGETRGVAGLADELIHGPSSGRSARAAPRGGRVFTSSSVREVMPVIAVDDRRYSSREAADALLEALRRAAPG